MRAYRSYPNPIYSVGEPDTTEKPKEEGNANDMVKTKRDDDFELDDIFD